MPAGAPPADPKRIVSGVWLAVLAITLLSCGLCSGIFYLVTPLMSRTASPDLGANTIYGSAALLGMLFGVVMVWQTIHFVRGNAGRTAASVFPSPLLFLVVYGIAIVLGAGTLEFKIAALYLFPPWHFIAASFVPLMFIAYAARRLGKTSGFRALFTAFSWGALAATPLALIFELIFGAVFLLIAAVGLMISPDSRALIEQIQTTLLRARGTLDPNLALQLLTNPMITGIILAYVALVVPLVEEAFKALGIAFIDPRRTALRDVVLWGVSAGAGFAIVENIFNASGSLNDWVITMLLRAGATTVHVANGILMGRGWYAARVERRWGQLGIAYVIAVILHSLWNAAAIVMSGGTVFLTEGTNVPTSTLPLAVLVGALALMLVVLTILGLAWIVYAVNSARASASEKI
jgi:RsiW-degrading membrane proteinase PrsW (M82 family)